MLTETRRRQGDGVVCGHIHKPEMREVNGLLYLNDGEWIESLSARSLVQPILRSGFQSSRVSACRRSCTPLVRSIHISTEGPLGLAARAFARRNQLAFTTAYHTRFPEYVRSRIRIPLSWTYTFLLWFHGSGNVVMAPKNAVLSDLEKWRIGNPVIWPRGVDLDLFKPATNAKGTGTKKNPIFINVGRVAVEKKYQGFP